MYCIMTCSVQQRDLTSDISIVWLGNKIKLHNSRTFNLVFTSVIFINSGSESVTV